MSLWTRFKASPLRPAEVQTLLQGRERHPTRAAAVGKCLAAIVSVVVIESELIGTARAGVGFDEAGDGQLIATASCGSSGTSREARHEDHEHLNAKPA